MGFLFWYVVSLLSESLYPHICQQHSLWFLLMCLTCLTLVYPLRFPLNYRLYARKDCAIMEGLVTLSLFLPEPPPSSVTARYISLVDSVKKVIVINFFPISYEMQVLFCFGSEKGRKHWLSYFSAFNPSYCWQLRCKFTEAIWIILICSVI